MHCVQVIISSLSTAATSDSQPSTTQASDSAPVEDLLDDLSDGEAEVSQACGAAQLGARGSSVRSAH